MRVLIVSQFYTPEPVPIPESLARGLIERGHEVRVLTGFPNYPQGELYSGYSQRRRTVTVIDGVRVHRVPIFVSHSANPIARMLNYLSFSISSRCEQAAAEDVDVVYVYATQMTAAMAPQWWRWRRGIPYVLHVQDLWPESVTGSSLVGNGLTSRMIASMLRPWLRRVYREAAATIAISRGMRDLLIERGATNSTTHAVYNWDAAPSPVSIGTGSTRPVGGLRLMYAGNIGDLQDLDTVVRALALLQDTPDISLTIVGSGVAETRIRELVSELGVTSVRFEGRVDQRRMKALYSQSDFQLVTLQDLPIFRVTVPSKFQASLAAGVPVITTVAGEVAQMVEDERIGFHVQPEDPRALAGAFRLALAMSNDERSEMGIRAKDYYGRALSECLGIDAVEQILRAASVAHRKVQR